jgi:hypothetical protein
MQPSVWHVPDAFGKGVVFAFLATPIEDSGTCHTTGRLCHAADVIFFASPRLGDLALKTLPRNATSDMYICFYRSFQKNGGYVMRSPQSVFIRVNPWLAFSYFVARPSAFQLCHAALARGSFGLKLGGRSSC